MKPTKEIINNLSFEPVARFYSKGNETQRCTTNYKDVQILWETYFPWSIFSKPIDTFSLDLLLPIKTKIIKGKMEVAPYAEENIGFPKFKTLESAVQWIDEEYDKCKSKMIE